MARRRNPNERTLEDEIDKASVAAVVATLASICYGKAAHIEDNWQDRGTASRWNSAGKKLDACAGALYKTKVPGIGKH